MTVMETEAGLLLHSPVHLDSDDVAAINRLGRVHAIIAPNLYHHFHVRDCAALFPKARVLVPEGLQEKIGPIARAEVMASDASVELPNEVEHLVVTGHSMLRETLLFHPSYGNPGDGRPDLQLSRRASPGREKLFPPDRMLWSAKGGFLSRLLDPIARCRD
jgi:hypothetical protein